MSPAKLGKAQRPVPPPELGGTPHPAASLWELRTAMRHVAGTGYTLLHEGPHRPACPVGDISLHAYALCMAPSQPTSNAPPSSAKDDLGVEVSCNSPKLPMIIF